jgi:hypothetical protein
MGEIDLEESEFKLVLELLEEWKQKGSSKKQLHAVFCTEGLVIDTDNVCVDIQNKDFYGYNIKAGYHILLFCKGNTIRIKCSQPRGIGK